jgi:hypothetical protein
MLRVTLGKGEGGRGIGVPVTWGEGLAGAAADGGQSILVQVTSLAFAMTSAVNAEQCPVVCFLPALSEFLFSVCRVLTTSLTTSSSQIRIFLCFQKATQYLALNQTHCILTLLSFTHRLRFPL